MCPMRQIMDNFLNAKEAFEKAFIMKSITQKIEYEIDLIFKSIKSKSSKGLYSLSIKYQFDNNDEEYSTTKEGMLENLINPITNILSNLGYKCSTEIDSANSEIILNIDWSNPNYDELK